LQGRPSDAQNPRNSIKGEADMRVHQVAVLSAVLVLSAAGTAQATFPGRDGPLTYNRFDEATNTLSIFSVKPRARHERQLTHFATGTASQFTDWSPDGRLIAFDSDQGGAGPVTYVMRADGSHIRQLTAPAFSGDPAWSPSGKRIAIEADWGDYPAAEGIWTFPFRHHGLIGRDDAVRVTTAAPDAQFDSEPQYSPNGRWIAFTRFRSAAESAIFRVRTDGTHLQQLTAFEENGSAPDWSPDGRWIVYDTHDVAIAPNAGNIVLMHPDGSGHRILIAGSDADYNQNPVFSPSGRYIAWALFGAAGAGTPPDIWTARVDGTHRRKLGVAGFANKPDWGSKPRHHGRDRHRH
jgi:Tol biopolymer transport system component